ncbi:RNA-binding protein 42 [Allomyces arbusculus]|nr:RNA-binding protein 42 [Allomyces arbusculus]
MSYPGAPLPPGAGASASTPSTTYPPAHTDDAYAAYYAQMMADPAYAAYYAQYYYGSATPATTTTAATTASVPVDLDSVIVKTESKKGKSTASSSKPKTTKSTTAAAVTATTTAAKSTSAAPASNDVKRGTVRKHAEMESGSATPLPPPTAPSKAVAAATSSSAPAASASGAAASADAEPSGPPAKKKRVLRYAAGQVWEDKSLEDWPDNDFRLFVGDLGPEVTTAMLETAFGKYESFQRAYVVKDKAGKSKGYGFVSFMNADDYTRAFRDYNNKYLGSRPVKLRKSTWQDRNIEVKKQKMRRGF